MNTSDDAFEAQLRSLLPDNVFRALEPRYLEEPRGLFHGQHGLVVAPSNVNEVAQIIRSCVEASVPVVPYGGGTGLVGGQIMPQGQPVILSLERMQRIRAVHKQENTMIVEAGAVLADVQAMATSHGLLFPLSLASEGSCRIGGCLSTNAGGVNVLRYGSARDLCLGVEAVLPDGSVHHGLKRLRKDNTGYNLNALLCGAEGSLGVITAASLRLSPLPQQFGTAFMTVPSPAAALKLLNVAQEQFGPEISAFELIKGTGLQFLAEHNLGGIMPFDKRPDWMVLIELGCGGSSDPEALLASLFETAHLTALVGDGVIAKSTAQRSAFWKLREEIPLANKAVGSISSHDVSVPLGEIAAFLDEADRKLTRLGSFRINAFGHLGDGNLHYNVFAPKGRRASEFLHIRDEIREIVYSLVHDFDGSFSAEHGIGRLKCAELQKFSDPARLAAMRAIKQALDPIGIMNPGVFFGS